ncbi:hypothetical protein [Stenotrophomonas oahuensis]|uniref:Uncharacterized protein n=1 Tax=Stenotrophomonas oahuensis TaxID=3003271 RepID=A0ABY9YIW8_9GAMM|nr:hypothetical protein [Stenotrophomonas sp. A5586]WNH50829.1 hypothetical protein PDM29_10500 [Stenotrophomonas sp. A5586]
MDDVARTTVAIAFTGLPVKAAGIAEDLKARVSALPNVPLLMCWTKAATLPTWNRGAACVNEPDVVAGPGSGWEATVGLGWFAMSMADVSR